MTARFLIGIDLGTTNSAVAYVDIRAADPRVRVFEVPQLVAPGEVAPRRQLPSFVYLAGEIDLAPHDTALPWRPANTEPGKDPQGRSYSSWASFSDPDGNSWLLQEITGRLPGRGFSADVPSLVALLRETEEHHGAYERVAPKHHWSEWYGAYMVARQRGRTPEEAAKDAGLHMEAIGTK